MEPIKPGDLVRDADGYYAIVLIVYTNGAVEIFVEFKAASADAVGRSQAHAPGLAEWATPADPPASFHEIIDPRFFGPQSATPASRREFAV